MHLPPPDLATRGLSVVAARDLVEGEPLFSLPPSAFISPEQPITLPYPYPLTPDVSPLSGWTAFSILAAWILREKRKVESGEGSQWGVYVRSLPEYVPLPVFFPDDLIQEFEVQSMIDHAFSYRETFKSEYERCDKAAIGNAGEEEFMWAVAVTDEQTDTIVVRSYAALPAGGQLYNSYGTKSTDMFLQAYGFVPADNPHDSFQLTASEADLAEIYYKHYANVTVKEGRKGMFDLWAEYLLRRTSEDVRAAKEKVEEEVGVIGGPKADVFGEGSAHGVWAGGQVDPRMLLFLASLWHVFGYGEGPGELVHAYRRGSATPEAAGEVLVGGWEDREDGTEEEEREEVGEGEEGEEEVCTKDVVQSLMERELVLQYRIAKKKLHEVYDRLEEGCSSLLQSESPESNSAEAASEGLKGLLPELTVSAPHLPAEQHDEL
ncbi:unnamed protein product [Closterium sp. Naga37s-1]|nr:unnamed protein product [Closterium sp. Naga37s-1]